MPGPASAAPHWGVQTRMWHGCKRCDVIWFGEARCFICGSEQVSIRYEVEGPWMTMSCAQSVEWDRVQRFRDDEP